MKILIADDARISRQILQQTLESLGHEVLTAENGQEALEIFHNDNVKFTIADWMMPVMDGLALCRKIRSSDKEGYVYFILLTGKDTKKDIIEGLTAGADDYITKPLDKDELMVKIRVGERILNLERELKEKNEELFILNKQLEDIASIDPLMNIGNRRSFYDTIEKVHHHIRRKLQRPDSKHEVSYGVIMCDIDHFKAYNDTYGHTEGDTILRQVAFTIRSSLRLSDEVFRFGGEEIVIILPNQDIEGTFNGAERIRKRIEKLGIEHKGSDKRIVTISCGVAVYDHKNRDAEWETIIDRADKALYLAKSEGRNHVSVYQSG